MARSPFPQTALIRSGRTRHCQRLQQQRRVFRQRPRLSIEIGNQLTFEVCNHVFDKKLALL